jgi:alkylated DNA repair dioxygenase AlkB
MKRKQTHLTDFFENKRVKENIKTELGDQCYVSYNDAFIENHKEVFIKLKEEIVWKEEPVIIFGKEIIQPRLVCFIADEENEMSYTGIKMKPEKWTNTILELKTLVEKEIKIEFNSVFCNLYRNGKDYIGNFSSYKLGYHADDVKANDKDSPIVSLSFGCKRKFYMKHKQDSEKVHKFVLNPGSLFTSKIKLI